MAPAGATSTPEGADAAIFLDTGETLPSNNLQQRRRPPPPAAKPQPATARRTPRAVAAIAALLLSAVLGAGWLARAPAPTPAPDDTIITEMAEPETPAVAPQLPEKEAEEVLPNDSQAPPESAGPAPAFVEANSKSPAGLAAATAAAARRSAKAPAQAALPSAPEVPAAAPTPVAAPAPAAPKPAPPAPTLCNDTNFFTRSACIYSECAKPANANLAMCVEHRSRLQKEKSSYSGQ